MDTVNDLTFLNIAYNIFRNNGMKAEAMQIRMIIKKFKRIERSRARLDRDVEECKAYIEDFKANVMVQQLRKEMADL